MHTNNSRKYILVLGGGQTQGLDNTTTTSESKYSINLLPQNDNDEVCIATEVTFVILLMLLI